MSIDIKVTGLYDHLQIHALPSDDLVYAYKFERCQPEVQRKRGRFMTKFTMKRSEKMRGRWRKGESAR